jgi:molybdopterin molybdotransferase
VDYLHQAIESSLGTLLIDAVLVRPGYHQLLAQLPDKFLIGLPGNPQSAVVGLLTLVRPFIAGSTSKSFPPENKRVLATNLSAPETEHKFVLCREINSTESVGLVEPVNFLDSSMLRGFVYADGYAIVKPGGQSAGSFVDWIELPK